MVLLRRANARSILDAGIAIIGVPDETGSHAERKGSSRAPDVLRKAWNKFEFFERNGRFIPICPMSGSFEGKAIYDFGNKKKKVLRKTVASLASRGVIPISIGGDHSITTEIVKGISQSLGEEIAIFYFDAHPDFVSSTLNYYGSVLADCSNHLDFSKSALVGTRAAEPEELENARKNNLMIMTPLDLSEASMRSVASRLKARASRIKKYISVDLDCLDPAYAPGVSLPSPCGLSPIQLLYLLKEIIQEGGVVGMDLVELSPDYDPNSATAGLAAKILSECIASFNHNSPNSRHGPRKARA